MMKLLLIPLIAVFLSGCDFESKNISIEKVGNTTYLINQKENSAFAIYGEKMIELKKDKPAPLKIGQTLKRDVSISSGRLNVDVKIKFMGSKILYNLHLKPVIKSDEKDGKVIVDKSNLRWFEERKKDYDSYNAVTIQLKDTDGFKLAEESVRVGRRFVSIVGKGSEAESYMYEGSFSVDPEIVQFASYIDIVWNLE